MNIKKEKYYQDLECGNHIPLSLEDRHLLPAVKPGPHKAVPPVLADHSGGSFCHLLDAPLRGLGMNKRLVLHYFSFYQQNVRQG